MAWRPEYNQRVLTPVLESQYQSLSASPAPNPGLQPQISFPATAAAHVPQWMEVDSSKAAQFVSIHNNVLMQATANHWHKFIVKTPVTDRKAVITAINKRISPLKLAPFFFRLENGCITFLVNCCSAAITTLCRRNLKVPYKSQEYDEIELVLQLCAYTFSIADFVQKIVLNRLDEKKKYLDMSYIRSIPEVQNMMYDPSDISHLLEELLKVGTEIAPDVVSLRLAGNELRNLNPLRSALAGRNKWKLRVLDLTYNKLESMSAIALHSQIQITELHLDQNPLCDKYLSEAYINVLKANFYHLIKLDGTFVDRTRIPFWRPNFILSSEQRDSGELADQFLEHFFSLYDADDRMWLRGLYHQNAYFSLTSMFLVGQFTSQNARLTSYLTASRNLLRQRTEKANDRLISGQEKVIKTLASLPRTQHDPYSFTVDLTHMSDQRTVLTVTGVFCERDAKKVAVRYFMRTFVLVKIADDEYQIINDILYVTNGTTRQAEEAFRYSKPPAKVKKYQAPRPELTESEKDSMAEIVSQLTGMSPPWSQKCLDDSEWNIREALQVFVELYKAGKIPKTAFVKQQT